MKARNIVFILFIALISITAVNAFEINENETLNNFLDDDVLSLDMSYESSTELLCAGEKNISINEGNYDSNIITNETNAIFYFSDGIYNLNISDLSNKNFNFVGSSSNTILMNYKSINITNSNIQFENIQFINLRFISSSSTLVFNNTDASNIKFNNDGGFINGKYTTITIDNSRFDNNDVSGSTGGTIFLNNGELNCFNSNFTNNIAFQAGAIYLNNINSTFDNCIFNNDVSTDKESGAIFIKNSENFNIANTQFESCKANYGAALTLLNSNTMITNSFFKNNSATRENGGIIYAMYGLLTLSNCNFSYNNQIYLDNITYNSNGSNVNIYEENTTVNLINLNKFTPIYSHNLTNTNSIPSRYDLREGGYVSSVKDQEDGGNCWAFAALSSLESCILKIDNNLQYDFSEENLKNLAAKYSKYGLIDRDTNEGGNIYMAIGYLASWLGAVNENDDKYCPSSCISPNLDNIINIQNVYIIRPSTSSYDNKYDIKKAILTYGAVVSSYYQDNSSSYFNYKNETINYYYNVSSTNHEIAIIGWDDNYSKNNFKKTPEGDGAWICKNSWGAGLNHVDYFYISYYDYSIAKIKDSYTFILNDSTQYNKNYQYDIQKIDEIDSIYGFKYYKNTFNSTGNEELVSISSYFDKNINYEISINVNGEQVYTQTFNSTIYGYFTVKLNRNISINEGDEFDVIIYNPQSYLSVCLQNEITKELPRGVSSISVDNMTWVDSVTFGNFVCCIKVFAITNDNLSNRWGLVSDGLTKYYGNSARLNATLINHDGSITPPDNKTITFRINGVDYNKTPNDQGVASLGVNLNSGNYTALISYADSCNNISINVNVTVKSTIDGRDVLKTYKNATQYYATFYDSEGNLLINTGVTFNINGVYYTRQTNVSGMAKLNINLNPDRYVITVFNLNTQEQKSNIIHVLSSINSSNVIKYYKNDTHYYATFYGSDGNLLINASVTFNINGVFYTRITNDDGVARLNINLEPGNYVLTAINPVNGEMCSNNITVLPILEAEDLTKIYGSPDPFKVKLLNGTGEPYANQNITFNIHGVFYIRTTDSNGIAKLNINLMSGNYIITSSYNGMSISNKIIVRS